MMLNTEILRCLLTYGKIYAHVGRRLHDREIIKNAWKEENPRPSDCTMKNHLDKAFAGELPLLEIREGELFIDEKRAIEFLEEFCKLLGIDSSKLSVSPPPAPIKKKREKAPPIPVIEGVESPIVKKLKKEVSYQKSKLANLEKEYQGQLALKEQELIELENQMRSGIGNAILKEMDKDVVVLTDLESDPLELFRRDYFLEHPRVLLDIEEPISKYGGTRSSFYQKIADSKLVLTTENYRRKIAETLFKSKLLEHRHQDIQSLKEQNKTEDDISANRRQSIQLLLDNQSMSNQMKLAMYAAWHGHKGTEMEELLNFAGDHCIEASYVIGLLERPKEFNTYENLRGFFRQACKASEARMKKEAARELIAGEWSVVADYNGQPCHFQMLPIEELVRFREALLNNRYEMATMILENTLSTNRDAQFEQKDPDQKLIVRDKQEVRAYFKEATRRIRQVSKGYEDDVYAVVDDDQVMDDFAEREVEDGSE